MTSTSDVVVVGGGVIGGAIAYALAKAGVRVTLLEARHIGGEASGIAAGMLTPLGEAHAPGPFVELAVGSLRLFPALAAELLEVSGVDIEYVPSGVLRTATTEDEEQDLRDALAWQQWLGLDLRWLSSEQVRSLEPALAPDVRGAMFSPDEGHVRSARLTEAYVQGAAALGASIRTGTPVLGFMTEGRRVTGVRTPDGNLACDHVVLAAGPWTGAVAAQLGAVVPVRPVKGQLLALAMVPTPVRRVVFGNGVGYLVPKRDGTTVVGATQEEEAGFDKRMTAAGVASLLQTAIRLVPALAGAELRQTWSGLRPAAPDDLPLLGPLPGWEGIAIASGHFRNGILLSAITGQLITGLLTTGATSLSLAPFSPGRFLNGL